MSVLGLINTFPLIRNVPIDKPIERFPEVWELYVRTHPLISRWGHTCPHEGHPHQLDDPRSAPTNDNPLRNVYILRLGKARPTSLSDVYRGLDVSDASSHALAFAKLAPELESRERGPHDQSTEPIPVGCRLPLPIKENDRFQKFSDYPLNNSEDLGRLVSKTRELNAQTSNWRCLYLPPIILVCSEEQYINAGRVFWQGVITAILIRQSIEWGETSDSSTPSSPSSPPST